MRYILMIHGDESGMGAMAPEEIGQVMAAMDAFDNEISSAGQNLGSVRLQPSGTATTVKVRGGQTLLTDGPFAETKEQLGGIYLIEAADLDEAVAIASRLPTAEFCTVEVRPLMGVDLRQVIQAES